MIRRNVIIALIVLIAVLLSIQFLDARIAIGIMRFIRSVHPISKMTEHIPDILPHLVGAGTIILWLFYFFRMRHKVFDEETKFLRLAATVLPASYLVKTFSKIIFGRTGPRDWLIHHQTLTFRWMEIWSSSFPSGHMIVFVAFGTAVLVYYPKYRRLVISLLILLALALILTDYHFLSDVIAGAYIGYMTTYLTNYFYEEQYKEHQ